MKRPDFDMKPLLDELARMIPTVTDWTRDERAENAPDMRGVSCRCFIGYAGSWRFVVASFVTPDRDGRSYDGAAMSAQRSLVIRMTPELAKKAGEAAEEATRVDQG